MKTLNYIELRMVLGKMRSNATSPARRHAILQMEQLVEAARCAQLALDTYMTASSAASHAEVRDAIHKLTDARSKLSLVLGP